MACLIMMLWERVLSGFDRTRILVFRTRSPAQELLVAKAHEGSVRADQRRVSQADLAPLRILTFPSVAHLCIRHSWKGINSSSGH
jgi:hypothetical protein